MSGVSGDWVPCQLPPAFGIPEAAFGAGGPGLFASIDKIETIELSMYLIGVTAHIRAPGHPPDRRTAKRGDRDIP